MSELKTPFPRTATNKKNVFAIRILVKSLIYAFAIFGILFILLLLTVLGLLRQESTTAAVVPSRAALQIDFDVTFKETRGDTLLTEISESSPLAFYDVVKAINIASTDDRVKILVGRISNSGLGLAQIQELRQAVEIFRSKGKKAYLFSNGFGSFGNGTSEYYLASSFDEIWMQPNTEAGITGIALEVPFIRGLLNKIGVTPEFYTRYEYKTAVNSLINEKMSKPFREELSRLGKNIFNQIIIDISEARNLKSEEVKKLVNDAPLGAEVAQKNGLIDKIAYEQELWKLIKTDFDVKKIVLDDYVSTLKEGRKGIRTVAVIVAEGAINEGKSIDNPLQGEASVGSQTIVAQLEEIAKNKDVKAVVMRINSPGGSYTASNEIWYALQNIKKENKIPVVISMGDYAASGGYFVALAGDKIVAEPSTVTGSIGVLGGKLVLSDLWEKLDVRWSSLNFGENAGILSANSTFSKKEKDIFNKSLDIVYKDFTLKVSQARKINMTEIDKLARGRIWTGSEALRNGLIDEIGGFNAALGIAKEMGGIGENDKFSIIYYPKQKTLQEKISEVLNNAPMVAVRKLKANLGLDIQGFNVLQRLQYDAALVPFVMSY